MEMQTPADLLALIPAILEREPEEMVVLVTLKDGQLQAMMGMEHLPDEADLPEYVHAIVSQMAEVRPDALVMVFYTATESECDHDPYEHVYILTKLALDALSPVQVSPGLLVKEGKFKIYGTDHWHELSEVKESALAAAIVFNGMQLEPEGIVIPEPVSVTDEVTARIDAAIAATPPYPPDIHDAWATPNVVEARALYEELLQRGFGATEDEAVRLIGFLISPVTRDRLMVDTITGTTNVAEFAGTITGNGDIPADPDRLEAANRLVDNLMQWTCDRHRLPLMVTQAWLRWQAGRTLDAEQYLELALEVDPKYKLARAFHQYIHNLKRLPDSVLHDERDR